MGIDYVSRGRVNPDSLIAVIAAINLVESYGCVHTMVEWFDPVKDAFMQRVTVTWKGDVVGSSTMAHYEVEQLCHLHITFLKDIAAVFETCHTY